MIKVFLVEDEVVLRNAIKNSIHWEREGYEFVGEASDGELAYPLILKSKPDILITDIKMPFMDGLELSKAVKKEMPEIKILILSGYNDFEYAQQAISIGITDYLLKPISAEKLLEAIGNVSEEIKKEREDKELLRRYAEEMKENTEIEKNQFFTRMLKESLSITEALEQGRSLGLELSAECYNVVLFKILDDGSQRKDGEQEVEAWVQVESYIHSMEHVCCFQRGVEGLAFLCMGDGEEQVREKIEEIRKGLAMILKLYPKQKYFGGIGRPVTRLRNLKDSFHEAERAFAGRFTAPPNQIVYQSELCPDADSGEEPNVQGLGSVEFIREMVAKFLRNGTEEELPAFIEACFETHMEDKLHSLMMRQYISMDIYIMIVSFGEELNITQADIERECGEMKTVSEHIGDVEAMKAYVEQLIRGMLVLRDTASGRRYSDIIESAQMYILNHYMSETISLNAVAASVNMSPSYFSSIFRQEVGKTFVEYLTEIRMEKAKELLMCSSKKTSEIGYEVGYKDSHYFSYIFKKTQKCTPKEYRARGKM